MDKIITLTVQVSKPSESCEEELLKAASELTQNFVEIYGGSVKVEYSAKK